MAKGKVKPEEKALFTTKIFQRGKSQAVRIPPEIQFERLDIDYEIERIGDEIRVRPAKRRLTGVATMFASFPDDFMAKGSEAEEQPVRAKQ